jgi:hypothetical protein
MQGTWSEDLKDGPGRFVSESGSAQQATFSADRLLPGQEEGEPRPGNLDAPASLPLCFLAFLVFETEDVVSKRCSVSDCPCPDGETFSWGVRETEPEVHLRYSNIQNGASLVS